MNKYGRMALEHWQEVAPTRLAGIEDPEGFFSRLGLEVESRVQELQTQFAGPDPVGEEYLAKVGRLNMARLQAEEMALAEMVWISAPETDPSETAGPSAIQEFQRAIRDADKDG